MRIQELTEYNKGKMGRTLSAEFLNDLRQTASYLTHFFRHQKPINIFQKQMDQDHFFLLEYVGELIGYFWCQHLTDRILQIKSSFIEPEYQNKGIGSEAYITLARHAGFGFVHDTQLSDQAEHIWTHSLRSAGMIRGIYDKVLDQTYSWDQVGHMTSDGAKILDPSADTSDSFSDPEDSSQRFFWLTESQHRAPSLRLLEIHRAYYLLGESLLKQDSNLYHAANRSPYVVGKDCQF